MPSDTRSLAGTLLEGGLDLTADARSLPPGATLRRGELRRAATTTIPDAFDGAGAVAALPDVTVEAGPHATAEFRIVRLLGAGGMGQVHLAEQRSLRREVAIKSVRPERADERGRRLLLHEASIGGGLEHPNIIPVHLLARDGEGNPVLVMKKVEGVAWCELIERGDHPWWAKLCREGSDRLDFHLGVLRQVCLAVEFAHDAGVIHRDIKPENVMLGAFGEVYLLDWGVASRLGSDGVALDSADVVGTPGFMAPEMVTGAGGQGPRTDVYLLGATLHNALTRRYRHEGANLRELLSASELSAPVRYPVGVPSDLAALCNSATRASPDERPANAREFRLALEDCVAHRGSMSLCHAARASLESLRETLASPEGADRDRRVVRASAACRFGFAQSLAAWADNQDASAGLQECLDLLFEYEIARDNLEGAEGAAAEMPRRTSEHEARLAVLRDERAAEARRVADLQSAALELDARVSSKTRARTVLAWGAIMMVINGVALYGLYRGARPTHASSIGFAAAVVACWAFVAWRLRASLFRNVYTRAVVHCVTVGSAAILVHRVIAALNDIPVWWVTSIDLMFATVIVSLSALTVVRWLAGSAVALAVGVILCAVRPQWSSVIFALATSVAVAVAAFQQPKEEGLTTPPRSPSPVPGEAAP